ncbi:3-hydroxyacyl-thioester dehydratase [Mycobacterium sp. E1747]|nr:3-hydroxyacyl-thioester dehydratase [Mycobacterium sp. E1747]
MLYALGIGAGTQDLAFTTNNTNGVPQRMAPTMPVTLGVDYSVLRYAGRFSWADVLHAEQRLQLLAAIPVEGQAEAVTEIIEMWDKGKAALVVAETTGTSPVGTVLWRSAASLYIKHAGGWGGQRGPSTPAAVTSRPHAVAKTVEYRTRPDQALIYRLSGDYNPLHSDPSFAAQAGFDQPILHGLCTFGYAGRAVLNLAAPDARLRSISARFKSPVYPGDTLRVDMWATEATAIEFVVRGRDQQEVLTGGLAEFDRVGVASAAKVAAGTTTQS